MKEPVSQTVIEVKSLNKTSIDLKVTLSALCNKLSIKPKDMQDNLMAVIDPTRKVSRVRICCYEGSQPTYELLEEPLSKRMKALSDSVKNGQLSESAYESRVAAIAGELVESKRTYSINPEAVKRSLMGTSRSFR